MQGVSTLSTAEHKYSVNAHDCGLPPSLSSTQPTPCCLCPLASVKLIFLTIALSNHMIKIDTEKSHYLSKECDKKANQWSLSSNLNRWLKVCVLTCSDCFISE